MATSYQASNLGLQEIDNARLALGWNKTDDRWLEAADVSRSTLNRFLDGQKVKHETFVNICKAVGIENWRRIRQSEMPIAAKSELMPISLTSGSLENFAEQMRRWFGALRYEIEQELEQTEDYFQWMIRIPVRSRFDRILLRGMTREIEFLDLHQMTGAINAHQPDETWLVTDFRVNPAVAEKAKMQGYPLLCMTFDELIDQDVDFSPYIQWLVEEVEGQEIDERYIQLGCKRSEIDPQTQDYLGTHPYPAEIDDGLEGYIDGWLEATEKYHVSVLGEFGMGKTWFSLHYAWRELQKYLKAKETQRKRPRLPLLMPLRDYSKAVDVENVLAHFFFGKHKIRLHNEVFDRLNEMGKLLLIFDGFDEMSNKTSKQEMADNFWRLTQVAVPGAKVILTSRQEHFPDDGNARLLFGGKIPSSQSRLVAPQFELVELEPFTEVQMRRMLGQHTDEPTVDLIMAQPHLRDLAQRPVMGQLLVAALGDLQRDLAAGKSIDLARVYYYAVRQKMETDIRSDRTFTSLADKTFFLGELAGAMYGQEKLSLHFSEFPEQLRSMFGLEDRELDYWCYDMAGETLLIRDREGNYKFAHNSLREFFVAYKFAAELGLLHSDFWGLVAGCGMVDSTWSEVRRGLHSNVSVQEFRGFLAESPERLVETFGRFPLRQSEVVADLLLVMLDVQVDYRQTNPLLELMQWTRGRSFSTVGYVGGNAGNLLLAKYPYGLEYQDLSRTVLPALNLWGAGLRQVDLTDADLSEAVVTTSFGSCNAIVVSADQTWFATGHINGAIHIWDTKSGRELQVLEGHQSSVASVAISGDSRWLFSGSYDNTIKKWDVKRGECLYTFVGHQSLVTSVATSGDGRWLFSGSHDNTIKKWDMEMGECFYTFVGHQDSVISVALSNDGRWLFSGSYDNTIKQWDVETGECLYTFVGHQDFVQSVALSDDGRWLFSGSYDNTIKQWDVETGECLYTFVGYQSLVTSVALSGDGRWLFSGSHDNTIRKWDLATGECIYTFVSHQSRVISVALSGDGRWLFSGSDDRTIKKWDLATGECIYTFVGYQNSVTSMVLSSDDCRLFSGSDDRTIKKWNVETGECLFTFVGHQSLVTSMVLSSDDCRLFTGSDDKTISKWDVETGECLFTFVSHQNRVTSMVRSSDDCRLFSGSDDKTISKWDVETGECLYTFVGHQDFVLSVTLSNDGHWLFSGSGDKTIKKWDVKTGECLYTFVGHRNWVISMALSGDGRWLFSGSHDKTIKKWDVETGECLYTFVGHQDLVISMALSSDGHWLFSRSVDNTIKQWDVDTGECLFTFGGHQSLSSVLLSSDDRWLFSGSYDKTIKKWDLATGELLATWDNRLCAGAEISGIQGLTAAQRHSLVSLGAGGRDILPPVGA
jgi:WD40 repeat protein